jgi:two-component sensor histidine kinase
LQPATAQTLALALHELVTNSAKYGALSTQSGRLTIVWETQGDVLKMVWEEKDGPIVERPASRGFGTRSVIASIETQLGGQAEFDWRREGLICRLSVPLEQKVTALDNRRDKVGSRNGADRTGHAASA